MRPNRPASHGRAGRSLKQTPTRIKDYEPTVGERLMIEISHAERPPRHLILGAWAVDAFDKKSAERKAEFEAWRAKGAATDYAA